MANSKITDLTAVTDLAAADVFVLARSGVSKKIAASVLQEMAPSRIEIFPQLHATVVQGSWGDNIDASQLFSNFFYNASAAQNDEVTFPIYLKAGTWELQMLVVQLSSSGIATILLDNVSQGTLDTYQAGFNYNIIKTLSGISVATSGLKTLSIRMATKNASASSYRINVTMITLLKTA